MAENGGNGIMMSKPVIDAALAAAFGDVMERGRVALFSAPCGFGKSVVSHALLRGRRVRELSADAADFALQEDDGTWEVLVLDQLQNLPEEQQDSLCQLLRTAAAREVRGWLAWLDISLPQRGVTDLAEVIPAVFRLMTTRQIALPSFSVTSTLPSIMNGGKDFSDWSRRDDLLYATIRPAVEAVLGRDGQRQAVAEWCRAKAPQDPTHFRVLLRYQYLTQAMVQIALGDNDAALLTLVPLRNYCAVCQRHIDSIHLHILSAIARSRVRDEGWREGLTAALETAARFGFVRTVSQYGAAALPLLERLRQEGNQDFRNAVMQAVRAQAANYPDFLAPPLEQAEALTATELQVLRLLCADKSNAEIGQILNIRLPTVKSHVSHILQKLNVSRRAEAKREAERLHLLPGTKV